MNTYSVRNDEKIHSTKILSNVQPRRRKSADDKYKNLKPRKKEYRETTDVSGLYFRVQPNGKKSWQFRYKNKEGKWAWLGLGSYPKVNYQQAFEIAQGMLSGDIEIKTQAELKQIKLEEEKALFSHLVYEWLDIKKPVWAAETFRKEKQSIEKHLIPIFGHRPFKSITPKEWLDFFKQKQINEKIFNRIEKLVSYCVGAYDLAKFKGDIDYNPLTNINKFLYRGESESMKHVSMSDLPEMIFMIRSYSSRPIAIALEMMIHMLPRPQEMRQARWEQFDLDERIWVRPAHVMKMGIEHAIPLSDHVIRLLTELKTISGSSEYLFPSRDSLNKPISNLTLNAALNRLGYRGRQNPHGFRHIGSTALNEQFSDRSQVIESALSHLKTGVKGAYDKSAHLTERTEIMRWWSEHLESILKK